LLLVVSEGRGMLCRFRLIAFIGCVAGLAATALMAQAGQREDCGQSQDRALAIRACTAAIRADARAAWAYANRGIAYSWTGVLDLATADFTKAIAIDPRLAAAYNGRGWSYYLKGDYQRAIADATAAIDIAPSSNAFHTRGDAYRALKRYHLAVADFTQALALEPTHLNAFASRGMAYEAEGERDKAITDYRAALALPAKTKLDEDRQSEVRNRLAALERPEAVPAAAPARVRMGRRVALVIGNGGYKSVPPLANPVEDARRVAEALRASGFREVVDRYDLSLEQMRAALSGFEDKVAGADWAVVYYAGHGIEVDGRNFLVPVDAQLKRTTDVEDETIALDRVLARVAAAKRLQLVILDACRENPFRRRMTGATRSIGERGLARIEPSQPNLMIAYAARDGQVALDGKAGEGSPYARALVKHLAEPGVELGVLFRRVRAQVLAETGGRQRPFEYGSLTSEDLYFRPAR
jgi:tetratricopeptide (TPR) repeat protein